MPAGRAFALPAAPVPAHTVELRVTEDSSSVAIAGASYGVTMNHWLLKTEPGTYSFDDLLRDKVTRWDGVSAPAALNSLRAMKEGDAAFIYHTGDEKAIVGVARIAGAPYADPTLGDPKRVVIDIEAVRPLRRPIPLSAVKADGRFNDLGLVRIGRLSVMPVSPVQWKALLELE